jgi:hypothetical protein
MVQVAAIVPVSKQPSVALLPLASHDAADPPVVVQLSVAVLPLLVQGAAKVAFLAPPKSSRAGSLYSIFPIHYHLSSFDIKHNRERESQIIFLYQAGMASGCISLGVSCGF